MFPKLINLTLLMVVEGVKEVLETYPKYPYQAAFSIAEFRNRLILDVTSQLPNYYTILEEQQELPTDSHILYASLEERVRLESLIHKSITNIFQENSDSLNHLIPQKDKLGN